jgi:WD40 repeat protein
VIHRDIKPANVWLEQETERVKLLDFGLARPTDGDSELTTTGAIAGTPQYMAPEQIAGEEIDARADLYSLGCVLYRMLTGRPPLSAPTPLATLSAIATQRPEPPHQENGEVSRELSRFVMSLLEKSAGDRPQSAAEVVDRIRQLEESASSHSSIRPPESLAGWWHRSTAARAGAAVLAIAAIVLATIVIRMKNKDGSEMEIAIKNGSVAGLTIEQEGEILAEAMFDQDGKEMPAQTAERDAGLAAERPPKTVQADEAEIKVGLPVKVAIKPLTIEPEALPFQQNEPLVKQALVAQPAPIDKVISWTIHSIDHRAPVSWSAVSPDGQYIASACMDMAIRVWEVETGRLVKLLLGHEFSQATNYSSFSVCWSPDGRYLASAAMQSPLILWEVASGRMLRRLECLIEAPKAMHWSPDGTRILITDGSGKHEGLVFDIEQNKAAYPISAVAAAWSPDAKTIALGGNAGLVQIVEAGSGQVQRSFKAHSSPVQRLSFTPDGRTLGTGTFEKPQDLEGHAMALWDVDSGECVWSRAGLSFVAFSPDGSKLMTSNGSAIQTWNMTTREALANIAVKGEVASAAWLPDGNGVMAGDAPAIWDDTTGNQIRVFGYGYNGYASNYRFSPDSRLLLHDYKAHVNLGTALWDLESMRLIAVAMPGHMSNWSPDSSQFAHGDTLNARIRDAATGEVKLELSDNQGKRRTPSSSIAFSPDGKQVVKLNSGNDVSIVEIGSGKTLQILSLDTPPSHVAWRPTGDQIAILGVDGVLQVRDLASGEVLRQLDTDQRVWPQLAWSRGGEWLAVSGPHGSFVLWNVDTDEKRVESNGAFLTWINDGSQFATSVGASVRIADAATGKQVRQLTKVPSGGSMSPDGLLYVGSELHTNAFYSGKDGGLLGKVHILRAHHHDGNIRYIAISPTGHWRSPTVDVANLFVYVVQTAAGQQTLTSKQFAEKYGWQNDPTKADIFATAVAPSP